MKSIILQNESGHTIEIRRSEKAGYFDIRHTRYDPETFGNYYEDAERVKYPPIASFLRKMQMEFDVPPGEGGAHAVIAGRLCLLDKSDIAMIRDVIKKFDEPQDNIVSA